MELAAIASAAVPGLAPTGVAGAPDDAADFDSALLVDDAGKQWRVRSPKHAEASMRLETELQALRAFTPAVKAELPFLIPHMAGSVRQGELSTFVYSHLAGTTRSLDALTAGGQTMARELGRVIAAIHELPKDMVQRADLPDYEANEYRQRKLNELDQAATTGRIPAILLRRWEHALEDVTLWRFSPTVVHGDLHEDHLLISAGRVSAVTGWTDLSISDPAEDFAWLAAAEDTVFVDAVHEAYAGARTSAVDPHLPRRAALAAEFALAQWLVRGVALEDAAMIHEAEGMLATLEADVESIEREQREAAERAQRAHEERLEWGNELGTDDPDETEHEGTGHDGTGFVATAGGGSDWNRGHVTGSGMSADEPEDSADAGASGARVVHGRSQPASVDEGPLRDSPARERAETGDRSAGADGGRPWRTGSHAYDPDSPAGQRFHRLPGSPPTPPSSRDEDRSAPHGDVDGTASGSSLAYARLTAGRQRTGATSATALLRDDQPGAGSPDDVATSALPIVSSRR